MRMGVFFCILPKPVCEAVIVFEGFEAQHTYITTPNVVALRPKSGLALCC
jgi:hypothetical protein